MRVLSPTRLAVAGFRMPVMDKIKDLGCCVSGKSEQGIVCVGDRLLVMPNRVTVKVTARERRSAMANMGWRSCAGRCMADAA